MEQGSPELISDYGGHGAHQLRPRCITTVRAQTQMLINQPIKQSMRALFNGPKTSKSHGNKSGVYVDAPPITWHSTGPELWGPHVWVMLCSKMMLSLNLLRYLFLILVWSFC